LTSVNAQTETKFNPEDPTWHSLRLENQQIVDLAKAVEGAALGTLEDAYTLIIPPLSVANKLPSEEGLVEMIRRRAIENHRDYQLDKAYSLYSQLLTLCDNRLLENERFVYKAVATTVDFLMNTASAAIADEGATANNEAQLKEAKAALIKLLKNKNLERFCNVLKALFVTQKRQTLYDSMLLTNEEKEPDVNKTKRNRPDASKKKDIQTSNSANFGHTAIYDQIISNKGDISDDELRHIDVPDILGWTPLHYAVIYAPDKVSRILRVAEILARKQDVAGRTPLHYAVMYKESGTKEMVEQSLEVTKFFHYIWQPSMGMKLQRKLYWTTTCTETG
jgi:hypothetical protein